MSIEIKIENLESLKRNLRAAPRIAAKVYNDALKASMFAILKQTSDSDGGLFQFVTERSKRTGYLARSFALNIKFGEGYATIGPVPDYAEYVYYGTSRGIQANPYLDRIAKASQADVQKVFKEANDLITKELAKP